MRTHSWRAISFALAGLAVTVALYLVGVSIALYERRSAAAGIPVAGAAAFGWVLLVFYTAGASTI